MSRRVLARRPSPAMLVAIVALVAAMAGTAVAGGSFMAKKKSKSTALQRLTYVTTAPITVPPTSTTAPATVSASCPTGYHPVGGGVKLSTPAGGSNRNLWWSDGYLTATGFTSRVQNEVDPPTNATAEVTVACVSGKAKGEDDLPNG